MPIGMSHVNCPHDLKLLWILPVVSSTEPQKTAHSPQEASSMIRPGPGEEMKTSLFLAHGVVSYFFTIDVQGPLVLSTELITMLLFEFGNCIDIFR